MYAIEREQIVRREPVGGDSFFYARHGGQWIGSAELGSIARAVGAVPDLPALARWIASIEEASSRTVFAGVHRLLPAQTLRIHGDGVAVVTNVPPGSSPTGTIDELAEALRVRLTTLLSRALKGSAHAGILVGGIDSCGLAAIALSNGAPLTLLTFTHESGDRDEPYVEQVARMYETPLIKINIQAAGPLIDSCLVINGVPCPSPGGSAYVLAARALRNVGADRMLTGVMGDELFGGHPAMLGTRVLPRHPLLALQQALRLKTPAGGSLGNRLLALIVRPYLRELLPKSVRARRRREHWAKRFSWTSAAFLEHLDAGGTQQEKRYRVPRSADEFFDSIATSVTIADVVDARTLHEGIVGLPQRDPLLDVDLARFTSALPYEVLNCDGLHRGLYRRALRGLLPETVRLRVTKADMNPDAFAIIKRRLDGPGWRERFSVPRLVKLGWVDPTAFRSRMESLRYTDDLVATWRFLAADAFLEQSS